MGVTEREKEREREWERKMGAYKIERKSEVKRERDG